MRLSRLLLLFLVYVGFLCLGAPVAVIGVAWPAMQGTFQVGPNAVAGIFLGAGLTCFATRFLMGHILRGLGLGFVLAGSSMLVAVCTAGYGLAPSWGYVVLCAILHGFGAGAIFAGLQYYLTHRLTARQPSWMGACFSLGAALGPLAVTLVFAEKVEWRWGYFFIGGGLMVLSLLFALSCRWWDAPEDGDEEEDAHSDEPAAAASQREFWARPITWLHGLFFFFCAGLELLVGNWAFTLLTGSRGVPPVTAGIWVVIFWGTLFVARLALAIVAKRADVDLLGRIGALTALAGAALLALKPPGPIPFPAIALVLISLGVAPLWPGAIARSAERLGSTFAGHAMALQTGAAVLGAAVLPSLTGHYAQNSGLEILPLLASGMALVLWLLHEGIVACARRRSEMEDETPGRPMAPIVEVPAMEPPPEESTIVESPVESEVAAGPRSDTRRAKKHRRR